MTGLSAGLQPKSPEWGSQIGEGLSTLPEPQPLRTQDLEATQSSIGFVRGKVVVRRRAWLLLVTVGATFVLMSGNPAAAHYVKKSDWVYNTSFRWCAVGWSETSHGSGAGYAKSEVFAYYWNGIPCGVENWAKTGHLAAAVEYWRDGRSSPCYSSGWKYNPTSARSFPYSKDFGVLTPCGKGWYGNWGGAFLYDNGWKGDLLWSGWHYFSDPAGGGGGGGAGGGGGC